MMNIKRILVFAEREYGDVFDVFLIRPDGTHKSKYIFTGKYLREKFGFEEVTMTEEEEFRLARNKR